MIITDLREKNWNNFFAHHLQDWQGVCTKYSPQGKMFEYFESLRSFRGNQEQTQVIQNNEYKYPELLISVDELIFEAVIVIFI